MHLALTPEQEKLQDELRAYFAELVTPVIEEEMSGGEMGGPRSLEAIRKLGADGWLGIGWPEEYGGQGASAIEQYIFYNEAQRAGAPVPFLTINAVAPTIMKFGSQAQKDFFLPPILRGELNFAIGYSEPGAGTDLASLTTKAVRDGDAEWVINGQKIFTSLAEFADYVWLAVRTNPEAKKHKGISIFAVPTSTPGFSYTPINVMGGARTNATYYDDVRVPH
nr:acyl-CoA dehydrogenase family protein [Actinomycetota bacterium]